MTTPRIRPRVGPILLVAAMRNEGPFILEWLCYHRTIGFTDVVVVSNDCIDGSPELLERLAQLGQLIHVANTVAPGERPQLAAYARAEKLAIAATAEWAMVLDADEFLNIHVGRGRVPDLIAAVPDATAFLVNWRVFGNSGHARWGPGFVTERFTRAAPRAHGVNLSFKTLFTRIEAYGCRLMPHQPRFPSAERLEELRYVDGAGEVLPAYFHDESRGDFLQTDPGKVSWSLAQVNHYNTRSREDYLVKHRRGGGLNVSWDLDKSWSVFNRNEEPDCTIKDKMGAARALYDRLLLDDELHRRHARCCELYCAHVSTLMRETSSQVAQRSGP